MLIQNMNLWGDCKGAESISNNKQINLRNTDTQFYVLV